jgi:hypothetical protein
MTAGAAAGVHEGFGADAPYRRAVLRAGAACGAVGAVVLIAANIAHPRPSTSNVGKHEAFLRLAADSNGWLEIHLAILLGTLLFLAGLVVLSYALRAGRAAWLGRAALVSALVGGAVGVVQHSLDAAYGRIADDWAAAAGADKATLFHVGAAVEDVDFTLLAANTVLFFGVTFVLYGLAVQADDSFPGDVGWIAVLAGVASIALGIVEFFTGPSVATLFVFPALAALLSLWVLGMAVFLWRRVAREPSAAAAAGAA